MQGTGVEVHGTNPPLPQGVIVTPEAVLKVGAMPTGLWTGLMYARCGVPVLLCGSGLGLPVLWITQQVILLQAPWS